MAITPARDAGGARGGEQLDQPQAPAGQLREADDGEGEQDRDAEMQQMSRGVVVVT